jgi:hypothetical protein
MCGNFHLYKILLIGALGLGSARNKYQKYFLEGKSYRCAGLIALQPVCPAALKSKSTGI